MKKGIVEYWSIDVWNKHRQVETIKVFGYEVANLMEAKKYAKKFGKLLNWHTIYRHD